MKRVFQVVYLSILSVFMVNLVYLSVLSISSYALFIYLFFLFHGCLVYLSFLFHSMPCLCLSVYSFYFMVCLVYQSILSLSVGRGCSSCSLRPSGCQTDQIDRRTVQLLRHTQGWTIQTRDLQILKKSKNYSGISLCTIFIKKRGFLISGTYIFYVYMLYFVGF